MNDLIKNKLILASTSKYRSELLKKVGISFSTKAPAADEEALKATYKGELSSLPIYLAEMKAKSAHAKGHITIGSDQALLFESEILGKGKSFEGAKTQLLKLSGKQAKLITAVSILSDEKNFSFESNTDLYFRSLSEKQIECYLNLDKPFDCAGSFKIEENGLFLFEKVISEDPSSIQGLPLMKVSSCLLELGLSPSAISST